MVTEYYIGLAALETTLFALFAAAVLVMVQLGGQSFSLITPGFLLRRPSFLLAAGFSILVTAFALAGAVRAAFPNFEGLPGHQHTAVLLENAWPAVGAALAALVSLLIDGAVLAGIVSIIRGPGLVRTMLSEIEPSTWVDWLDFSDPPNEPSVWKIAESDDGAVVIDDSDEKLHMELDAYRQRQSTLRARHDRGGLADPLAPIFEVAIVSIQARRYALVDVVLAEAGQTVDRWLEQDSRHVPESSRSTKALLSHLNDVAEVAASAGAVSQIAVVIRQLREMAKAALDRKDEASATMLVRELTAWICRFAGTERSPLISDAASGLQSIATMALRSGSRRVFDDTVIALGRAAEATASVHVSGKRQPVLELELGDEERPEGAILNALYQLTGEFTEQGRELRHWPGPLASALSVSAEAYLAVDKLDARTDRVASNFTSCLKRVGLAAAATLNGGAVFFTAYQLKLVAQSANKVAAKETLGAVAWAAFEIGMLTEAKRDELQYETPISSDPLEDLADVCEAVGTEAFKEAVEGLFLRGHTSYIPMQKQRDFLKRVESRFGHQFFGSHGLGSS